MASPIADFVVSLRDGRIVSQGTVSDALESDKKLAEEFKHDEKALELDESEDLELEDSTDAAAIPAKGAEGKLVVAEEIAIGHVSWHACECPTALFFYPSSSADECVISS